MKHYCVIGHPIKHSLSPIMHKQAFQELGIEADYTHLDIKPQEILQKIIFLKDNFDGWNITIPHKKVFFDHVDFLDPIAKQAASINTIINKNGQLHAYSTDGYGLAKSITENFQYPIENGNFTFIGAGGAARACAIYLAYKGAKSISIINRTIDKAQKLAVTIKELYPQCQTNFASLDDDKKLGFITRNTKLIIQSTSIGLQKDDPTPLPSKYIHKNHLILDMIYHSTKFQEIAQRQAKKSINGIDMLLFQGVKSFELWTGITPPIQSMRKILIENMS